MRILTRVLKAPSSPIQDFNNINFPVLVSDKEDGIRCIICPERGPVSQTHKAIPNDFVRESLLMHAPFHLDGELVVHGASFHEIQSAIMSKSGKPNFEFRVFDCFRNIYDPFTVRHAEARSLVQESSLIRITLLPQTLAFTPAQLDRLEHDALARGKEGLMLRDPRGWYKEGVSSLKEGLLLKIKRFQDDEAVVIGMEEQLENCNGAKLDARGLSKRSSHAANKKPAGVMGKLVCEWQGKEIRVGGGFTADQRELWWHNPELIIGQTITFKYQSHGTVDLPRSPQFKGVRYD